MSALPQESIVLDTAMLTGTWHNTNVASKGIPRIDVVANGAQVRVRAFGAPAHDWGFVDAPVFAAALDDDEAMAFSCVFDLGYADAHMQANLKGGVLVVATFNRFKDASGRSGYFMREFYYR
jgi:hypothetical protein